MVNIIPYVLLPVGFIFLIKGADLLVDGASSIAKRLGISAIVIGLTVVAFGTSMPEMIVSVFAGLQGNTDIAIANVLGSNIANILLILGVAAFIFPLQVKRGTVWKEIPFSLLAIMVVALMANDAFFEGGLFSGLTRIDGLILLSFFAIFLYYTFGIGKTKGSEKETTVKKRNLFWSIVLIVLGVVGLAVGGKIIVDSAVAIAIGLGVSQAVIGLTIVAIGTSLPELATSAIAAFKKNADIAVGNVVGSNIFNLFLVLGVSSTISPLPFSALLTRDVAVTLGATILLFMFMFIGKRRLLERWQGATFVVLYISYIILIVSQEIG